METYRVGECFYYEESDKQPYQIRRISELGRSATGEPEIKVVRFLRKTDLPPKLAGELEVDDDVTLLHLASDDVEELSARELFLCQDVETVPVSQIRGRCTVAQHIGVLPLTSYLNKEDSFFTVWSWTWLPAFCWRIEGRSGKVPTIRRISRRLARTRAVPREI